MKQDKILICDDDSELCEFIGNYLIMHNYQTVTLSKSDRFLHIVEQEKPDLIILDVDMPDQDGLTLCQQIRERYPFPILFLTGMSQKEAQLKGFEAGADDYIVKPFQFRELLARIKANLRWGKQVNPASDAESRGQQIRFDGLTIDLLTYEVTVHKEEVHLLPKEAQLLILLASNPQQIFSQEQLYSAIWGEMSSSGLDTVKVHIRNIRKKIEPSPPNPVFIETVRGLGYRFIEKREAAR